MWHKLTKEARESGKLIVLGVVQEQHSERTNLYKQWQQFEWQILHDPVNALRARAVPYFVAIDEAGVVVDNALKTSEYEDFLKRDSAASESSLPVQLEAGSKTDQLTSMLARLDDDLEPKDKARLLGQIAEHRVIWRSASNRESELSKAIDEYKHAIKLRPDDAHLWFGLGVATRMRFDVKSELDPESSDFQDAVHAWGKALELDPNQYIYRRRIQQYGPRLIKPYPFYDWVEQARREIRARGEEPKELRVEPTGAEFAQPQSRNARIASSGQTADEPDPQGAILRDQGEFLTRNVVVVPGKIEPGESVRVHVSFAPKQDVHWNNEAERAVLWVAMPDGWKAEQQRFELKQPSQPESDEVRKLEFEAYCGPSTKSDFKLNAYLLFYACESRGGQCVYRRADFKIPIEFKK